jgi:long-chain acyl-CoA synthetase
VDLIDVFKPFTWELDIAYRCDNIRALYASLTPDDRARLPWAPETIDWRHYFFDVHFPGLQEWVFPILDDEFGPKPRSVYTYKALIELFDATTKLHRHRVAMRLLRTTKEGEEGADPDAYTYGRVHDMAQQAAAALRERGIAADDRVMLMAENRPEWGIVYFGILKASGVAVPVDFQLSLAEVVNVLRASGAEVLAVSAAVARRLADREGEDDAGADDVPAGAEVTAALAAALARAGAAGVSVVELSALLDEPAMSPGAIAPARRGDGRAHRRKDGAG